MRKFSKDELMSGITNDGYLIAKCGRHIAMWKNFEDELVCGHKMCEKLIRGTMSKPKKPRLF